MNSFKDNNKKYQNVDASNDNRPRTCTRRNNTTIRHRSNRTISNHTKTTTSDDANRVRRAHSLVAKPIRRKILLLFFSLVACWLRNYALGCCNLTQSSALCWRLNLRQHVHRQCLTTTLLSNKCAGVGVWPPRAGGWTFETFMIYFFCQKKF